jgi:hypothetical protein
MHVEISNSSYNRISDADMLVHLFSSVISMLDPGRLDSALMCTSLWDDHHQSWATRSPLLVNAPWPYFDFSSQYDLSLVTAAAALLLMFIGLCFSMLMHSNQCLQQTLVLIATFGYSAICRCSIQLTRCINVAGVEVLASAPDILCWSGRTWWLQAAANIILGAFVMGVPVVLAAFGDRRLHLRYLRQDRQWFACEPFLVQLFVICTYLYFSCTSCCEGWGGGGQLAAVITRCLSYACLCRRCRTASKALSPS